MHVTPEAETAAQKLEMPNPERASNLDAKITVFPINTAAPNGFVCSKQ